jgi:transcriptional regulator with XRE-family HTH domain
MMPRKIITGKIIRHLRSARGLGIRDLEKMTGINRGNLSKIERGSGFGPVQLGRIAGHLQTTPAVICILTEILADRPEMLEDDSELCTLCANLTRLLNAYMVSPQAMQQQIDELLDSLFTEGRHQISDFRFQISDPGSQMSDI